MIILPNGIKIDIIGKPGATLLKEMIIEYNEGEDINDTLDPSDPNLIIFLGKPKEPFSIPKVPILISILSKEDYDFIESFCKENELPLLVASPKKVFKSYYYLNLPIYNYINIALSMLISVILKNKYTLDALKSDLYKSSPLLINIDQELLSISPEKFFHLRWFPKNNVNFLYEPGSYPKGLQLTMEWMQQQIYKNIKSNTLFEIHTIIDIDEIPNKLEAKDYLINLTTLAQYQNSFLIVNSDLDIDDPNAQFDFLVYTSLMEVWNNTHFIPKRKQLSEPLKEYSGLRKEETVNIELNLDFDKAVRKPPIFIIDNFDSIVNFVSNIGSDVKTYCLYIGKKQNYLKILR